MKPEVMGERLCFQELKTVVLTSNVMTGTGRAHVSGGFDARKYDYSLVRTDLCTGGQSRE